MSELTLKLIFLLIPGAIATLIYGKLILHKEWSNFKFILYSSLFGVFSYTILELIIQLINKILLDDFASLDIWRDLTNVDTIPYDEIVLSSIISVFLALIMARIINKSTINKLGQVFGVSNRYGDDNLYSSFLNNSDVENIFIRDYTNNIVYHGSVNSFSENEVISEIELIDVAVYTNDKAKFIYEVPKIYLSFKKENIIIEVSEPLN